MASSEDDQDDQDYSDDFAEDTLHEASKSGPFSGAGAVRDGSEASAGSGSWQRQQSSVRSASEDGEDLLESTQHDAEKFDSMLSSSIFEAGGAVGDSHPSARSAYSHPSARSASATQERSEEERSTSKEEACSQEGSEERSGALSESGSEDEHYSDSFDEEDTALDSGPVAGAAARLSAAEAPEIEVNSAADALPTRARQNEVTSPTTPGPHQAATQQDVKAFQNNVAPLPSDPVHWRADALEAGVRSSDFSRFAALGLPMPSRSVTQEPLGKPLSPCAQVPRGHDAVPRHLKPHAWDLASLGQEAPPPRQAWLPEPADAQPARSWTLEPTAGGARGFGGKPSALPVGVETQLVNVLAQRFLEQRNAPMPERRERAAYQEMLQQVAWTALEPALAEGLALLLSRRSQAPVSSAEALRAFRRCLHAILTDDRVLDIIEHQMMLHFSQLARPVQ